MKKAAHAGRVAWQGVDKLLGMFFRRDSACAHRDCKVLICSDEQKNRESHLVMESAGLIEAQDWVGLPLFGGLPR